ncbi:hypothetical protein CL630_01435 [bacterium]|nr:hypothetical protein [bacterium]|tara:strand:+ start:21269 stop:21448 length:180 start_codon:yes stop_codon:yes gene_type:complete
MRSFSPTELIALVIVWLGASGVVLAAYQVTDKINMTIVAVGALVAAYLLSKWLITKESD